MKHIIKLPVLLVFIPAIFYGQSKPAFSCLGMESFTTSGGQCMCTRTKGSLCGKTTATISGDTSGVVNFENTSQAMLSLPTKEVYANLFSNRSLEIPEHSENAGDTGSLYKTTAEQENFKAKLLLFVTEFELVYVNFQLDDKFNKIETDECLPGSVSCSLLYKNGIYCDADFGTYGDPSKASEKYNELTANVALSLSGTNWAAEEVPNSRMLMNRRFTKKTNREEPNASVSVAVQQIRGSYYVHLTVELQHEEDLRVTKLN